MAKFKVGQKVRYIAGPAGDKTVSTDNRHKGAEAIISSRGRAGWDWTIKSPAFRDGIVRGGGFLKPDEIYADSCQLRPLSDPKADEFIARIKGLKPYDEPKAPAKKLPATHVCTIPDGATVVATPDGPWIFRDGEWTKIEI